MLVHWRDPGRDAFRRERPLDSLCPPAETSKHFFFYIPTPTWSEKKRGITEEESDNRMQLNGDFRLLSVRSWACCSRRCHRNWDGCVKLQEGKSRPSAASGNDGRCACAVLRSSIENRKADFSNGSRARAGCGRPHHTYQCNFVINVKVTRLTAEVSQQGILSDPESEDEKFSDGETHTHTRSSRLKSVRQKSAKSTALLRWISQIRSTCPIYDSNGVFLLNTVNFGQM